MTMTSSLFTGQLRWKCEYFTLLMEFVTNALPSVFFATCLVNPMIHFQNPSYRGGHLGINYLGASDPNILCNSSAIGGGIV